MARRARPDQVQRGPPELKERRGQALVRRGPQALPDRAAPALREPLGQASLALPVQPELVEPPELLALRELVQRGRPVLRAQGAVRELQVQPAQERSARPGRLERAPQVQPGQQAQAVGQALLVQPEHRLRQRSSQPHSRPLGIAR